jgi:hypothetical protein
LCGTERRMLREELSLAGLEGSSCRESKQEGLRRCQLKEGWRRFERAVLTEKDLPNQKRTKKFA